MTEQKKETSADTRLRSGHVEAAYRYAHHMGSGERVPAMAWATWRAGRVELCGDDYPKLTPVQLEAKAVAILRNRRVSSSNTSPKE